MQLAGISSTASTAHLLNPVLVGRSAPAASSASAPQPAPAKASSASASANAALAAQPETSHPRSGSGGGGGSAAVEEVDSATSFSTSIAGKQYSGSGEQSGATYTASVPNLAGATATGSSIEAAENNLTARIDELA